MQQLTSKTLLQQVKVLHFCEVLVYDASAIIIFDGDKINTLEFTITDPSKLVSFCNWKSIPVQRVATSIVPGEYIIHSTGEVRGPSNVSADALRKGIEEHGWRTFGGSALYSAQYITVE